MRSFQPAQWGLEFIYVEKLENKELMPFILEQHPLGELFLEMIENKLKDRTFFQVLEKEQHNYVSHNDCSRDYFINVK